MKRCLACNARYDPVDLKCPKCGAKPAFVDGFFAYAPEFAHESSGFKSENFADLAHYEERNFWFVLRNHLIIWVISKFYPGLHSFFEVGCGTGFVLSGVAKAFPDATLFGSEIFTTGLSFAAKRLPSAKLMQMDGRHIPFVEEFDVIGAFDVLEHIEEDEQVLTQLHAALKHHGVLLLTVPQHPWLWSATDERACHVRRYTSTDLSRKIETAGFQVLRSTSFVSLLLPAMVVSRLTKRNNNTATEPRAELKISPWLNYLFTLLLRIELALIKIGVDFPVGGSRLVVARKA